MLIAKLIILALIYFSFNSAIAQTPVFKNYNTHHGLPSSETYCAIQDSKGYMWFGTDRGIVKFDGYNFRVFTTADGLTDNTVFEFFRGNNDEIWFKTFSTDLGFIRNDSIFPYQYNDKIKTVLSLQTFSFLMFGKDGSLFITKKLFESRKLLIYRIDSAGKIDSSVYTNTQGIKKIFTNRKGERVVTGWHPLYITEVYEYETGKKIMSFPAKSIYSSTLVHRIKESNDFYLFSDKQVFNIKDYKTTKLFDCDSNTLSLFVDNNKDIWLGGTFKGVERYTFRSGYKEKFTELKSYSVSSIIQDSEGGMWFTTLENGIHYLPPKSPLAYTQVHGLSPSNVKQIESIDDNIIVHLSDNSFLLKNKNNSEFSKIIESNPLQSTIKYVAPNNLYVSNQSNSFRDFGKNVIVVGYYKIHIGKKNVWLYENSEVRKISGKGNLIQKIFPGHIPRILVLYEIKNGDLLLGTTKGMYRYNGDSVELLRKHTLLCKYRISDIKRLNDKMLVIATMGQGVFILNESDFSIPVHYTTADGLPSNLCNVVMADGETLWVGTNKGIGHISNVLSKQNAKVLALNISDGLVSNEINDIKEVNGEVWLATSGGISVVSKKISVGEQYNIPVYIENITVNGKPSPPGKRSFLHTENDIVISFVGLHFQHTSKLVYKYRMGGDEHWNRTINRSVVYNSLPPGDYTFEVGVIQPNGQENQAIATYSFTIYPPFWQTWWFITTLILIGSIGIYIFINYRMRFIRRQEQLKNDLNTFRDKALRNQMNPHFIYNSLNSIQNYIVRNNAIASSEFLAKFSQLMRLTFNNTDQESVSLEKDLEALQLYAELENLRFADKFTLHIEHNLEKDISRITVPPLILQPFVENAILHGLLTKKKPGNIWLKILRNNDILNISITDDGIGREQAEKIKERKHRFRVTFPENKAKSSGITTTLARIEQAWGKNPYKSEFKIVDLRIDTDIYSGTSINFSLPVKYD